MEKVTRFGRHSTFQASEASQSILTLDSDSEKPVDSYNIVRIILLLLGIGSLLSITTLFAAPDYLQLQLELKSDQEILYFITPSYILPNLIVTIFMVRYGYYTSFQLRIVSCFLITAICLSIIPILFIDSVCNIFGYKLIFYIILLLIMIIGISSAILSISILGFSQFFPIKYLRTLVIGQSIATILICIIRIGIKLIFGLETGGVIYFSIAAGINILCAILFIYINTYSSFVAYYICPYLVSKDQRFIETKIKQIEKTDNNNLNSNEISKNPSKSIRHSVAIIPSQLSYFSNIQHFKNKNDSKIKEKKHPNSPNRQWNKSQFDGSTKKKKNNQQSPPQQQQQQQQQQHANTYNVEVDIFYEKDKIEDTNTSSMPTKQLISTKTNHKRTRSNTDNDIIAISTNDNDLELKYDPIHKHSDNNLNNLNDASLTSYSIQSASINAENELFNNAHSQPNTLKSGLLSNNNNNNNNNNNPYNKTNNVGIRDHAKSEIVVYPQTYISGGGDNKNNKLSIANVSPQNVHKSGDINLSPPHSQQSGFQFIYNPHRLSQEIPCSGTTRSRFTSITELRYEYSLVARKINKSIFNLFMTFFMTYLVFPGLILDLKSQYKSINNNDWFPVILATEFCIFDLFGRYLNGLQCLNDCGKMNILSSLRLLLYPLFIMLDQQLIIEDNIVYIIVGLVAFTNGFFVCSAFVNVPHKLYQHEQEIGAAFMGLASTLSVTTASLIALVIYELFKNV